jgi:hypothetical protein
MKIILPEKEIPGFCDQFKFFLEEKGSPHE